MSRTEAIERKTSKNYLNKEFDFRCRYRYRYTAIVTYR